MATPELLTFEAAAEALKVSFKTVERMASRGDIDVVRVGRLRRLRASDVAAIVGGDAERGLERETHAA
jgi:excisionase family DNA binding protein